MSHTVQSPHDKFFKFTFSRKSAAIAYIQAYLPHDITAEIDFDSLQIYPGECIDEQLTQTSSDLVYKVKLSGKLAYLYFLFEHQSTSQPLMAFRLLKYMTRLWDSIQSINPNSQQLPIVIPMVLYQGKARWRAPLEFIDLVTPKDHNKKCYIPGFRYLVVDLVNDLPGNIVNDIYTNIALVLMRAVAEGTLFQTLSSHGKLITQLLEQDNALDLLEVLFRYSLNCDDSIDINHLQQVVEAAVDNPEGEKTVGTLAEKLIRQGLEQGLEQGREEGREQGEMSILQKQLLLKFPDAEPVDLRQYSSSQLEMIAQRLMTCDLFEEVFDR